MLSGCGQMADLLCVATLAGYSAVNSLAVVSAKIDKQEANLWANYFTSEWGGGGGEFGVAIIFFQPLSQPHSQGLSPVPVSLLMIYKLFECSPNILQGFIAPVNS